MCATLAVAQVRTRRYTGDDPLGFAIAENVRRRHLSAGQRDFVALAAEPLYAAEAAQRQREAIQQQQRNEKGQVRPLGADLPQAGEPDRLGRVPRARDRAARSAGASGRGVAQAKRIARQAPDLAEQVRTGAMSIDRAERIVRDREAEQRRVEQARAEAAGQPVPLRVDLRHGDSARCRSAAATRGVQFPQSCAFLPAHRSGRAPQRCRRHHFAHQNGR
ncbi:MAG: hypothetical protein ACRDSL_03025 [Pseudonocardiaceae bacterium]